ncbi:MAG: efflux RND transporter periplasmic adaptor subunit [Anaerolineales bacterium]|uniref:efflux RND transporter periplasmic adaptor subunit n=1 Tax=Candidatus Villigracilis proximus TaxID=3140683 RepID=UPI003134757A|nr:efflux RND transporter periplasmic adaptor subunit [Anaerolineales bacterium]
MSIAEYDLSDMREDYYEESVQVKRSKAKLEQAQVSLQQAEWRLEQATLKAPINGNVTTLFVESGEMANSGQAVIILSDLANLDVDVNLDETDVARIEAGMTVVVIVDAFPGMEVSGEVIKIAPTADVQSGVVLYPVTVRIDPTDLPLRSGMTVNVMFTFEERRDTLVVPFRAVETEGGQAYLTRVTVSEQSVCGDDGLDHRYAD